MADLAARVGLRKASLFHHFASKEELRRAVLARLLHRVRSELEAATSDMKSNDGFSKGIDALTDAVVGLLGQEPYAARLVLREAMEWDAMSRDSLCEAFTESLQAGERFLTSAQKTGTCQSGNPKHIVATLVGMHLLPFALGGVMERFTGHAPWSASFIAERRSAVRDQVRALLAPR
jgi:AcrR family transcriptional regulator